MPQHPRSPAVPSAYCAGPAASAAISRPATGGPAAPLQGRHRTGRPARSAALLALGLVLGAAAAAAGLPPASCSSDGQARPVALLERFTSADCESCWADRATPAARRGELALDWVVPSARGDEAPLSAAALPEARERLDALHQPGPAPASSLRSPVLASGQTLRVALGLPLNDYIGATLALRPAGAGPWSAWLVLVERVPAGEEGSPVPRQVARAVFRPDWDAPASGVRRELRALRIPEGAKPERLSLLAWVQDARGRVVAAAQSACASGTGGR